MKKLLLPCLAAAFATTIAQAAPADDIKAAAQKLADAPNYAWTRTTEIANSQFPSMPIEGMTEKGGYTVTTMRFNENSFQTVRKGEQSVSQDREGNWLTSEERRAQFANAGGGGGTAGRGSGRGGFGFGGSSQQNPAEEIKTLLDQAKNFKTADGAIVGELSAEAVAQRLTFGGRGRGGDAPAPKNASGTLKVWLKDGAVAKYQTNVKGVVPGRDGETERNSTTTVEIKNVGGTKVTVPDAAKKKLGA